MAVATNQVISFARGVPAPECLAVDELAECARAAIETDGRAILSYGPGAGYAPLRSTIAELFDVHPARIVITNGSLNGFVLLAQMLARGRVVFHEFPTYDRALKILLQAGATLSSVPVDENGLVSSDFENLLRVTQDPGFVYTIPTFQNPTGQTMSVERREHLVQVAARRNVMILEDDPYSLIRFEGEPLPSLFAMSGGRTIYSSSFSKTISPGLRVGYFILPEELAAQLEATAAATYITPVLLAQATVNEFLQRGYFDPNLERVNGLLKARRDAMVGALEKHFSGATFTRPQGGYFIWLELGSGHNAKEVLDRAEGVTAVVGTDFGGSMSSLRLAYSFVSPEEIEAGVERLANAV